jgi:hypothetical protein
MIPLGKPLGSSAGFWRAVLEALPVAIEAGKALLSKERPEGRVAIRPPPPSRTESIAVIAEERARSAREFRSMRSGVRKVPR